MKHTDPFKDSFDINESISSLRTKLKILKNAYVKEKQEKTYVEQQFESLKKEYQNLSRQLD